MGKSCQIYVKDLLFSFNTQWLCFDFTFVIESTIKKKKPFQTDYEYYWNKVYSQWIKLKKYKTIIIGLLVVGFNKNIGIQRKKKKI